MSERRGDRLAFSADLGFLLCATWFALWRMELFSASPGSIWVSWWPAIVLVGLTIVILVIGAVRPRLRGFLPYTLRWLLLAASLVLPAWIALTLADTGNAVSTMRAAASELGQSAEAALAEAKTPEEKQQAQAAIDSTEAIDKLASVIEAAKARGIEVPRQDLSALGLDPTEIAEIEPATREMLEHTLGIAKMNEPGQTPQPGFSDLLHEFGLDDPMVKQALIGLAAVVLGPILGVSPLLIEAVLGALLSEGGLSFENLLNVTLALSMSTTKSGKLSAAKFKKNYKIAGEGAKAVRTILSAVEKRAGPQHSQGFDTLREAANEDKALTDECSHAIATAKQERAAGARRGADDLRLRKACDELSPQRLTALVEGGT